MAALAYCGRCINQAFVIPYLGLLESLFDCRSHPAICLSQQLPRATAAYLSLKAEFTFVNISSLPTENRCPVYAKCKSNISRPHSASKRSDRSCSNIQCRVLPIHDLQYGNRVKTRLYRCCRFIAMSHKFSFATNRV